MNESSSVDMVKPVYYVKIKRTDQTTVSLKSWQGERGSKLFIDFRAAGDYAHKRRSQGYDVQIYKAQDWTMEHGA